jgi:uncharacterized protein with von Willebrand factor type A (vWA) domain
VIRLIKIMAERLRESTRSRQQTARRAGLDFKRTISSNIAAGGALFKLKYKRKHGHRQRILTLCDVSASMYRFSGFVLKFISCLHFEVSATENYIFSQDIEHLNIRKFTTSTDIEQEIVKSRVWKKGTDVSRAISHLLTDRFVVLNSSTVVIIVSDAKTLNARKCGGRAEEARREGEKDILAQPHPGGRLVRHPRHRRIEGALHHAGLQQSGQAEQSLRTVMTGG